MSRASFNVLLLCVTAVPAQPTALLGQQWSEPRYVFDGASVGQMRQGTTKREDAKNGSKEDNECQAHDPPEALFEWAIGHDPFNYEKNGNGNGDRQREKPLVTDRPDFTESSRSVGRGRIQVEMGYLFTYDREFGEIVRQHSYPNILLRLGLFTEWFELRIGHTFSDEQTIADGLRTGAHGAEDLLLGFRFDLTEQKGCLPESSLVLNMILPVGSREFTAKEVLPGAALWYSWELVPEVLSLAGGTQLHRARDETGTTTVFHRGLDRIQSPNETPGKFFVEFAQSFSLAASVTDKVGSYIEWFAIIPSGSNDPATGPAHSIDGGFTYQPADNLQFDIFAGFGISRHAPDFFAGTGLVYRY